jgi:hypothetical protein
VAHDPGPPSGPLTGGRGPLSWPLTDGPGQPAKGPGPEYATPPGSGSRGHGLCRFVSLRHHLPGFVVVEYPIVIVGVLDGIAG